MTPTGRLANKVALVTGAASGIGRATAILLAKEGAAVALTDIAADAGQKVAAEITGNGGKSLFVRLDVSDESAWENCCDQVLRTFVKLDIAVNSAGIAASGPVADITLAEWRRVLQVNLDGVFLGTKYAIRAMRADTGGSIINVASVSGINAYPEAGAYGASKAAVRHLSRVAAIECADAKKGIRVNVVTPSGVKTPMWETMDFFKQLVNQHGGTEEAFAAMAGTAGSHQFFTSEDVAKTIVYLASDESSHLNGVEIVMAQGHVA